MFVQRWLTLCQFRLRHWCRWPQRHLRVWTGGSNPNLNAGRDRIDRRTNSNPLIGLIFPIVISGSDHLCRFSILIPFSFRHRSPPFLLAHSRAQLIDPRTLLILASARCCFGPADRSASAHSAQQSRCTHAEAQTALSFHPPSTPSSLSLIRLFSHPRPPSPCSLAHPGALRVEV
jgi:hypothetical protein